MSPKAGYHHGNLKAALVAAALKEIAQHGVDELSLRSVARRAGVSAPAVYRHFADKDALIGAAAMEAWERLSDILADAVSRVDDEPLAQFRAHGVAMVRFAAAHPEHFQVICIPGVFPPEFRAKADAIGARQFAAVAKAQADGLIANIPIDDLVLAADSLVLGLAQLIASGRLGKVDDARATALATAATNVLGVGLIPRAEDTVDPATGMVVKGSRR